MLDWERKDSVRNAKSYRLHCFRVGKALLPHRLIISLSIRINIILERTRVKSLVYKFAPLSRFHPNKRIHRFSYIFIIKLVIYIYRHRYFGFEQNLHDDLIGFVVDRRRNPFSRSVSFHFSLHTLGTPYRTVGINTLESPIFRLSNFFISSRRKSLCGEKVRKFLFRIFAISRLECIHAEIEGCYRRGIRRVTSEKCRITIEGDKYRERTMGYAGHESTDAGSA